MTGKPDIDRRALAVASISTLVGLAVLHAYMQRFEREASGGPKHAVLVMASDAKAGRALTREQLTTRALPEAYLEPRHISAAKLDQVVGTRLAIAVNAQDALLSSDLARSRPAAQGLAQRVPEGMRALTLAAGANDALLEVGDRVDVVRADERERAAAVVAQALLVLAVGDRLERESAGATRNHTVTLAVTPEQGAQLAVAELRGRLRLLLRRPDDVSLTAGPSPSAAQRDLSVAETR